MRFLTVLGVLGLALMATPVMAQKSDAQDMTQEAAAFVENVAQQAINTIDKKHDGQLSEDQAKVDFRKILSNAFDIPTIAKFTMGRYWRVATSEQKTEYTKLLQVKILDKYADSILAHSGAGFKTNSSKAVNDNDFAVDMTIIRKGAAPVDFGWRLRRFGNDFKVVDISVEGISMSVTHRSDFASVIERNGGKVEALLDALRQKEGDVVKTKK